MISRLNELLMPIEQSEFFGEIFSRKHFHLKSSEERIHNYDKLLSIDKFKSFFENQKHSEVRVTKNRELIPNYLHKNGGDKREIYNFFNAGYSLIYDKIDENISSIKSLCRDVKSQIKTANSVYVNAFLTPANSQALLRHVDWQHVIILQLEGEKKWNLFDSEFQNPLNNYQTNIINANLENAEKIDEINLKKGDLLYVPKGMAHEVQTLGSPSLHLTLTIETITYYHVFKKYLEMLADSESSLREEITHNQLDTEIRSHMSTLLSKLDSTETFSSLLNDNLEEEITNFNINEFFGK